MSRLLALLLLAIAPLVASAHGGHHGVSPEASPAAVPQTHGAITATMVATSRCPGGGHDDCCCHDGWCTTGSATPAALDAPVREVAPVRAEAKFFFTADPALPSAALLRYPTRGPPAVS